MQLYIKKKKTLCGCCKYFISSTHPACFLDIPHRRNRVLKDVLCSSDYTFYFTNVSLRIIYNKLNMNIPFSSTQWEIYVKKFSLRAYRSSLETNFILVTTRFSLTHTHILTRDVQAAWYGMEHLCVMWMLSIFIVEFLLWLSWFHIFWLWQMDFWSGLQYSLETKNCFSIAVFQKFISLTLNFM